MRRQGGVGEWRLVWRGGRAPWCWEQCLQASDPILASLRTWLWVWCEDAPVGVRWRFSGRG